MQKGKNEKRVREREIGIKKERSGKEKEERVTVREKEFKKERKVGMKERKK